MVGCLFISPHSLSFSFSLLFNMLGETTILPISCNTPAILASCISCSLNFMAFDILSQYCDVLSVCICSLSYLLFILTKSVSMVLLLIILPCFILSLYILLSASLYMVKMVSSSLFLVEAPIANDIITDSNLVLLDSPLILSIISSVLFSSVLGRSITNSSPPTLHIISSFLHDFLSISEALNSSLSPISCP